MKNYTIAITTFSKRYDFIVKLLPQIREHTDNKILLIVNGEKDGAFDDGYRQKVLRLCSQFYDVYPIFFIETRGLSKLWNTAIVHSHEDYLLILNDDLEITTSDIFNKINEHINSDEFTGLTRINRSFSHYIVNKEVMEKIGYFDERLMGFGEEDGDMAYRLLKAKLDVVDIHANGVVNIVSNTRHDHVKSGIGKYSHFNRDFIYNQKYVTDFESPYRGMFDTPMAEKLGNLVQYPYETFFRENKSKL